MNVLSRASWIHGPRTISLRGAFALATLLVAIAASAQSGAPPSAGGKTGSSSTLGTGGSSAGGKMGSSSTLGTGGSSAGTTGLDRADQVAGKHGAQGRRNARKHHMH